MDTEALLARVGELTAQLDEAGEELAGALMELYGEGLERIMAAVDDEHARARLADDGVVASLLLMHGLYPVPLEAPGARGARERAAVHGVPRRRRRAAAARGRRRADPARGPLPRLLGVGVDARARDPPGARGVRARPRGAGGRGRARGAHARAAARRDPAADGGRRCPRAAPAPRRARDEQTCELCADRDLRRAQAPDPPRASAGSSAPARPAGRCAPATPSSARSATAACGWTSCRSPTSSGRRSRIPIGLAFFMISSVTGERDRALPEPRGRDRVRAGPARRGRACARPTPSSSSSPTRRR